MARYAIAKGIVAAPNMCVECNVTALDIDVQDSADGRLASSLKHLRSNSSIGDDADFERDTLSVLVGNKELCLKVRLSKA
jgi:hypothetical protein